MKPETSYRDQKAALRKSLRQQRRSLDPVQKEQLDSAIILGLTTLITKVKPSCIAAYWPFDGEPDLRPVLDLMQRDGIRPALPVIFDSSSGPSMAFRQWSPGAPMTRNRYGIPEPSGTPLINLLDIDLVLLPLVGWDAFGARLGMGAGYYDRVLQPFAQELTPMRVGVAYHLQKVPRLPAEPWDIRLHGVVCESGWSECPTTT
jgi:5-formyltetrahydrofolate cyclo-ligase